MTFWQFAVISGLVASIHVTLFFVLKGLKNLMSADADLVVAVKGVTDAFGDEVTRVTAALTASHGDDPIVVQAVSDLNSLAAKIKAFDPTNLAPPATATTAPTA